MAPAVNEPVEGVSYRKKTTRYSKKLGKYAKKAAIDSGIIVHDLTELAVPEGVKSLVATEGRDEAIRECRRKVEKISKECRADNIKYRDPHFDLRLQQDYCLNGLKQTGENVEGVATPATAKRVGDIYDDPKFIVDGIDANDIKQGSAGDCWFLAAIATIANMPSLLDNICVARDEKVGVYGFIFFRDGEWVSEIVDDQLYISYGPYVDASPAVKSAFPTEQLYIEAKQRGSKALHFASCADSNETWLPLLEKAFAKAHGDYTAIEGGFTGEGVEDLTGGVTTELRTEDILDRDEFWTNDLLKVNDELLFAGSIHGVEADVVNGIMARHAYSILRAVEIDGERLVQVRNPWGQSEWTGPWSDGSKEWTAEWLTALDHKFGDDGSFWMTYADFLRTFSKIDRTRIFSSEWTIAQAWTLAEAQWPAAFSDRVFRITLTEASPVVIVLQQVDTRYFVGLEGQYDFELHFRIKRAGESEYVARTRNISGMSRSVTKELELEAGTWDVSFRVARIKRHAPRSAYISAFRKDQSDKFIHIARSFDYAFAKGLAYAVEEEEVEEEEVEEVEEEAEPAGDEDKGVEQAEEEEQQQEEQPQQQQQEEEDPSEQDTVAVVGLRVHALDRDVQVQIIQLEEPDTTLDPDASCVHSFLESSTDKSGFLSSHIGSSRNLA